MNIVSENYQRHYIMLQCGFIGLTDLWFKLIADEIILYAREQLAKSDY
jgi:hypothetical protein